MNSYTKRVMNFGPLRDFFFYYFLLHFTQHIINLTRIIKSELFIEFQHF